VPGIGHQHDLRAPPRAAQAHRVAHPAIRGAVVLPVPDELLGSH
jgi:hypothetical protein